jgi:molybdopterin-guanine dinucleotide biosynthesis protein A
MRSRGMTLAERTTSVLRPLAGELLVASPWREEWEALGARVIEDVIPGAGPLGGIAGGLHDAHGYFVIVVAADMPRLSADLLCWLLERAASLDRSIVPMIGGRPEPLHSVLLADDAMSAIEALDEGVRKVGDWLARIDVTFVDEHEFAGIPGAADSFRNVNTLEDVLALGLSLP